MFANNRKIAVTGASGHIGNVVCRQLLESGFDVRALYHSDDRAFNGLKIDTVNGNILHSPDIEKLLVDCDVVINCAAFVSISGGHGGKVFQTNVEGPRILLAACQKLGVRKIIHVSSVHAVTELPHSHPYDETRPYKTERDTAYDYSKAEGEKILLDGCKDAGVEVVIVRPSCVIGPWDFKPSMMGAALMDFYNQKIPFLPFGGYDLVDVRDIAVSIISSIDKGVNGQVYLLSGKYYDFKEYTNIIGRVTGKKMPKLVLPYWLMWCMVPFASLYFKLRDMTPAFTYESLKALKDGHPQMDNQKACTHLGHTTRALEDTLRDFYDWQKQQKKIS